MLLLNHGILFVLVEAHKLYKTCVHDITVGEIPKENQLLRYRRVSGNPIPLQLSQV
jgi:hypothetical protein